MGKKVTMRKQINTMNSELTVNNRRTALNVKEGPTINFTNMKIEDDESNTIIQEES